MIPTEFGFAAVIALSLVGALVWGARQYQTFLQRLISNHMTHNTEALNLLTIAIDKLVMVLDRKE